MNIKPIFTLTITLGLILMAAPANYAQPVNQKQPDPFQSNEQNPLYGNGINPLDLIHNANLLNSRSAQDFIEDTNENLDKAADDFKKLQLQRMQQQQELEANPVKSEEN
jgi:hypothetical protein